jgi:hypothetical protein
VRLSLFLNKVLKSKGFQFFSLILIVLFLGPWGCGGGSGGGDDTSNSTTTTTLPPGPQPPNPSESFSIMGSVVKGPVDKGLVKVWTIAPDGKRGASPIGEVLTDTNGNFSLSVGNATGLMELNLNSGNFVDEVTGDPLDLAGRNPLRSCLDQLSPGGAINTVAITPYTTLGCILADFKILDGNPASSAIASANQEMSSQHIQVSGLDLSNLNITNILPNVSLSNPIDFTDPSTQYGLIILGLSQQAFDIDAANPGFSNFTVLDLLEALELDITDGTFDGKVHGSPIELVSGSGVNLSPDALKADLTNSITNFLSSNVLNPLPSTTTTTTSTTTSTTTTTISGSTTTTSATTTSTTTTTTSGSTTTTSATTTTTTLPPSPPPPTPSESFLIIPG